MDSYLGEIIIWSANWLPQGFAWCNGQLLIINQNQALYAIIGTTYGGNGSTNFALPDLRGILPLGAYNYAPGSKGGVAMQTLTSTYGQTAPTHLTAHTHNVPIPGNSTPASAISIAIPVVNTLSNPVATPSTNTVLSVADDSAIGGAPTIYSTAASNTTLKPFNVTLPGQGIPATNSTASAAGTVADGVRYAVEVPGVLSVNFLICVNGIFPSRA